MIKGIIFDMDGVLVNSEPLYHEFEYKFFNNLGAKITREYLLKYVGSSMGHTVNSICDEFNITVMPREEIFRIFSQGVDLIYSSNKKLQLCEGVMDWLNYFRESNYPMIVASSTYKEKIKICLERFEISHYFKDYIGGNEVKNSKPDPEIFLEACKRLNFNPSECMVIEDSENGIKAAKEAGCFCIGYLNKGQNTQDLRQSNIVFDRFGKERISLLKKYL